MGRTREPDRVKGICGIISRPEIDSDIIRKNLREILGDIDSGSGDFDFSYTNYYESEMGRDLRRMFFSFRDLIEPDAIAEIKLKTNAIEDAYAIDGKRRINLDPGFIHSAKLVLATTKNFAHRVYIRRGIYGDVQLRHMHGKWVAHDWTYPDYQTPEALAWFTQVRQNYQKQVKHA